MHSSNSAAFDVNQAANLITFIKEQSNHMFLRDNGFSAKFRMA
jgi:hypothetical protein